MVGDLHRHRAAGVGDRDHHVDVPFGPFALDLLRQVVPHPQSRLVDRDVFDDGIGTGEIDVFEDAGRMQGVLGADLAMHLAVQVDEHRLARQYVGNRLETEHLQRHTLRGDHVAGAAGRDAPAVDQRADAIGVAEAHDAIAGDHGHHGIGAPAAAVHPRHGSENILGLDADLALHLQFVGKHVQQHL